jgi:hypothetical protein
MARTLLIGVTEKDGRKNQLRTVEAMIEPDARAPEFYFGAQELLRWYCFLREETRFMGEQKGQARTGATKKSRHNPDPPDWW